MSMEIVGQLMQQLNLDEQQAKGGMGLLLGLAKDKLSTTQFSEIVDQFGAADTDEMINAAPESGGMMGMLGGLMGSLGGAKAEGLGNLAELAGGFSKLNMDPSMIQQFIPIITQFLQEKGGAGIVEMLQGVLGGNR